MDQTRGWFYSLHALSILLTGEPCYRNVICLGLILDEQGQKMSKHTGNVVEPWGIINSHGADATRWYLFTASQPGESRRFSDTLVNEVVRRFVLTLWNVYSFFTTYASIDKFHPEQVRLGWKPTAELDRWILSELNVLIDTVDSRLSAYDPTDAGRRIEEFVDLLSNWYVRRSRRRFWKSENDEDKLAAYATLYQCLTGLCRLLAPFAPFLAEEMYQNLERSATDDAPTSVHLSSFPQASPKLVDQQLMAATRLAMRVSSMGRSARAKSGIKVRQPLRLLRLITRNELEMQAIEGLSDQLKDELNVKEIWAITKGSFDEVNFWGWRVAPEMSRIGPKYGSQSRQISAGLAELNPASVAADVKRGHSVALPRKDMTVLPVELAPEEISITRLEPVGFSVVEEGDYVVAVDTSITPELADEGVARELVHRIQNLRRSAGFELTDKILTFYQADEPVRRVMDSFSQYIKQETLSEELVPAAPHQGSHTERLKLGEEEVVLGVKRL